MYEPIEAEWHIYASMEKASIGLDDDLLPAQCQAITWPNINL